MNLTRLGFLATSSAVMLWCATATAALTGQYLFENNLNDTSGFNRHGSGAAGIYVPGIYQGSTAALQMNSNGSLNPNQAAQSVILPASTDFVRDAPGATLMAWVRLDGGTSNRTILSINNGAGASRATLQVIDGGTNDHQLRALGRFNDSEAARNANSGATAVPLGQPVFLAGVFDYANSAIRVYLNGQQVGSSTPPWGTNVVDTTNLNSEIGSVATPSATNQEYWPGVIDGARIFNTAFTAEAILDIYLAESLAPVVLGDTDGDTIVELSDLDPIRQNYLQNVSARNMGDLVDDDIVDFQDFRQWKTAYLEKNSGGGSLAGVDLSFLSMAVPEPSAACLALLGTTLLAARRGRRIRPIGSVLNTNASQAIALS